MVHGLSPRRRGRVPGGTIGSGSRRILSASRMLAALPFFILASCDDAFSIVNLQPGYGLALEVSEEPLEVGETREIRAFRTNEDDEPVEELPASELAWSSSEPEVASVEDGSVTGEDEGSTTVTAEATEGLRASTDITVEDPGEAEGPADDGEEGDADDGEGEGEGEDGAGDDGDGTDLPLFAEAPHDAEPATGRDGWTGSWFAPSFGNASVVTDAGAAPPFDAFVRTRYPAGMDDGRGPVHWSGWDEEDRFKDYRHVRIEKWIRIGGERSDFESHPVGTKMGFLGAGACSGARNQLYPFLEGGLRETFSIRVIQQFLDRKNMTQNVTSERVIRAGEWQKWEFEMTLNDIGHANGTFRLTVDDRLIIDYDDVKFRDDSHPCGFQEWRWNPTWGGFIQTTKEREDHIDIARVRIWGEPL